MGKLIKRAKSFFKREIESLLNVSTSLEVRTFIVIIDFIGCRKRKESALYANFGLLILSFICSGHSPSIKIAKLKNPEEYAASIKACDQYFG